MEEHPTSEAVAEYDRFLALRMIVPFSEIPAESLEAYWTHWKTEGARNPEASRGLAKEFEALELGETVLRLPDGSRWVSGGALLDIDAYDEDPNTDNSFIQHLHRVLVEHKTRRNHFGPLLSQVFLNAETLDLRRGFCLDCWSWLDLTETDP